MVDMGSITAAVASLKAAGEIALGLVKLKTVAEVQAKAIELNQKIIEAQHEIFAANAAQTTLIQRVSELERQIASIEGWERQKQRYQMATPFAGMTVYALRATMSEGEPPHYICANCYQNGRRSILQMAKTKDSWTIFVCPNPACRAETRTPYRGGVSVKYAEAVVPEE